jgi:Domain of unknown function (DUF4340)
MNLRVTIGFVAVAALLAALVVGLDRFNIGPPSTANADATATATGNQQPQIFSFDDTKVTAFELHQGDKTARVEKQGDNWVVAGTGDPANKASFTSLILRMSQLKATRQVPDPGTDLSQYGLDTPKDSAIAELGDGTRYQLDTGNKTPVQTGTYAKKSDAPDVYLIADQFVTDVERLVNDPREPPTPTPLPTVPTATPVAEATPTPGG